MLRLPRFIVKIGLIPLFIAFLPIMALADDSVPERKVENSFIGLDFRPVYPFSSYKDDILREMPDAEDIMKTKLAASLHLKYGFSLSPRSSQGRIYPGAWQGVGTAVNFLGNRHGIGVPIDVYVFQGAPIIGISEKLSLYYEWNFGASFGWKPCNGNEARSNLIVGSKVNAYINLGVGFQWKFAKTYALSAGLNLTHFSNGNTSFPNPGVNMAGVKVGVTKSFGKYDTGPDSRHVSDEPDSIPQERKLGYDITLYGAWRKRVYRGGETPILLNGHFGIVGFDFAPMWRVARNFRAGPSLDIQWDESTDLRRHHVEGDTSETIKFTRPPFFNQVCLGLSGRAELVMPIFSVNIGFGYNFIGPEETRATYQLANLKVRIIKGLALNIGYQLQNFQKQSNLMLGFAYSIH